MVDALKQAELQQNTHYRAQSHRLQKAEKYISKLQRNMEALHDAIKKKEKALHWWDGCICLLAYSRGKKRLGAIGDRFLGPH